MSLIPHVSDSGVTYLFNHNLKSLSLFHPSSSKSALSKWTILNPAADYTSQWSPCRPQVISIMDKSLFLKN